MAEQEPTALARLFEKRFRRRDAAKPVAVAAVRTPIIESTLNIIAGGLVRTATGLTEVTSTPITRVELRKAIEETVFSQKSSIDKNSNNPQELIDKYIDWNGTTGIHVVDARLSVSGTPIWCIIAYLKRSNSVELVAKNYKVPREAVEAANEFYEKNQELFDARLILAGIA